MASPSAPPLQDLKKPSVLSHLNITIGHVTVIPQLGRASMAKTPQDDAFIKSFFSKYRNLQMNGKKQQQQTGREEERKMRTYCPFHLFLVTQPLNVLISWRKGRDQRCIGPHSLDFLPDSTTTIIHTRSPHRICALSTTAKLNLPIVLC